MPADVDQLNPAGSSYAYFIFTDTNNDERWQGSEPYSFLFGNGYDLKNPDTTLNTVGNGYSAEMTSELLLGVEHSFLPEFVVGLTYTYRNIDDIKEFRNYVRPTGTTGRGFTRGRLFRSDGGCRGAAAAAVATTSAASVSGQDLPERLSVGLLPLQPHARPSSSTVSPT